LIDLIDHICRRYSKMAFTQGRMLSTNMTPCFRKNWTLCYFIISLLWQLRIAWKFSEVHRTCCLLWIWNIGLRFV